jgi:hypothetical protein
MADKHTWPCLGKPELLAGQPIGMYHCEYCGEMQIAGTNHLPPQFPEYWTGEFPKVEYVPPLVDTLHALDAAALARDSAEVCFHLEDVMRHPVDKQKDVWGALHAHRDDVDAQFILEHLDISKDDNDNWVVSLKGEVET